MHCGTFGIVPCVYMVFMLIGTAADHFPRKSETVTLNLIELSYKIRYYIHPRRIKMSPQLQLV